SKESRRLVKRKASERRYKSGILSQGTLPRKFTLFSTHKRREQRSHDSRISPSPAMSSVTFRSRASASASSANGNAFRGCIRPAQRRVRLSPVEPGILSFERK